jgi:hypothetical protein
MPSPTILDERKIADMHSPEHQADLVAARKQIKNAFQASMFIGGLTTFIWLASISGAKVAEYGAWLIIDVALCFGFGYGIFRNNPLCAKLMFGYYLLSNIIQIAEGHFPVFAIPLRVFILRYFWLGIVGTNRYRELMATTESYDFLTVAPEIRTNSTPPTKSVPIPFQPLEPTSELLSLCGGDRSQAQWLLSQIKIKHPSRSSDWYNRRAVEQLRNKNAGLPEVDEAGED